MEPASPHIEPSPESPADPSPGSEPEPVLPRGGGIAWRFQIGCFLAYLLMAIEIIGLPLGIVFGLVTGEWRWIVPWAGVAITVFILGRLDKIPIYY